MDTDKMDQATGDRLIAANKATAQTISDAADRADARASTVELMAVEAVRSTSKSNKAIQSLTVAGLIISVVTLFIVISVCLGLLKYAVVLRTG